MIEQYEMLPHHMYQTNCCHEKKGPCHFMKTYLAKEWKWCALFVLITLPLAFLAPYKSYVIQWLIDAESAAEIPRLLALGGAIFLSVFLLEWAGRNIFRTSTRLSPAQCARNCWAEYSPATWAHSSGKLSAAMSRSSQMTSPPYKMSFSLRSITLFSMAGCSFFRSSFSAVSIP